MADELEESEVVFEEANIKDDKSDGEKAKRNLKTCEKNSVPVGIRDCNTWLRRVDYDLEGDEGELVPPHVILGRRVARKMAAFSFCTENGRTLKGRDLNEVRNSILRLTGFLE